ncbi:MAG TPA: hypothetical protein VG055_02115, partial [Planctomycetaceae bacterium]|nr:hypothetical protein [Planctomycetaceae bacterium]
MNLRPLVLGLSLLAGAAPVALAQQTAPQQADENDLGLTPAQLADFADQPNVIYAAGPAQPESIPGQPASIPGQPSYPPAAGQPNFAAPQTLLMGYQATPAGPVAPQQPAPQANSQQMLTAPPSGIAPYWPNANIPQPMMQGPPGSFSYGSGCGPIGPDGMAPGPGPAYDGGNGACPNGVAAGCSPARPCWYFRGDSVWLSRSHADNHNLTSYENLNNAKDRLNSHVLLSTDDVTYPLEPGMRLTLGRYLTDTWMIEGTYYGAVNWDRRNGTPNFPTGANGVGPLLPYWGPGFGAFDTGAFTGSNVQTA